jgi:hypothetical protein
MAPRPPNDHVPSRRRHSSDYRFGEPKRGQIQFDATLDRFDRDRFPARGGKGHSACRCRKLCHSMRPGRIHGSSRRAGPVLLVNTIGQVISRSSLTSFVTYDKCLLDAAQAAGLPIDAPARQQSLARRHQAMKRPAMRGTQHEAIPRHRSTSNLARFARPTPSPSSQRPVTSHVTTPSGSGSHRRTSSDDPITVISADPIDLC